MSSHPACPTCKRQTSVETVSHMYYSENPSQLVLRSYELKGRQFYGMTVNEGASTNAAAARFAPPPEPTFSGKYFSTTAESQPTDKERRDAFDSDVGGWGILIGSPIALALAYPLGWYSQSGWMNWVIWLPLKLMAVAFVLACVVVAIITPFMERRFSQEEQAYKLSVELHAQWQAAMERWDRLLYCKSCRVFYLPDREVGVPEQDLIRYLYHPI